MEEVHITAQNAKVGDILKYNIDGTDYDVLIEKKKNKHTYIRIKDEKTIHVTTNYFVTKIQIKELLDSNIDYLKTNLKKKQEKMIESDLFYIFGEVYDIIIMNVKDIEIINHNIYTKDMKMLEKWFSKEIKKVYEQRLNYFYNLFEENIPYPNLKLRKMKTRWGVCNRKTNTVTLNTELVKYDITKLDYVVVHELSHFVHFNHSKEFWGIVSKYCHDYKKIRKELRD